MRNSEARAAVTIQRMPGAESAHTPEHMPEHTSEPEPELEDRSGGEPGRDAAGIYREVQRSAVFREVRRRYRSFAFPMTAAFLLWYLAYVLASITAPGVMATPVLGALNVAMVAGLAQFATTFLLTWAYARHARLRRDPAATELRWAVTLETLQHARPERPALTAGPAGRAGTGRGELR